MREARDIERLRVAQVILGTESEGPGRRAALWLQGCPIRCPECCNQEMWPERGGRFEDVDHIVKAIVNSDDLEGLTLLGGEPFAQAGPASTLCRLLRERGLGVIVYTGYPLEDLQRNTSPGVRALLEACDLLIDGPFDANLPEERRPWIGSANQRLHFFTERYSPHDFEGGGERTLELRLVDGQLTVNGWPSLELER